MQEKIYDGAIFKWNRSSGEFTGVTDARNIVEFWENSTYDWGQENYEDNLPIQNMLKEFRRIVSKMNYDDFGEKMPRSISVKSPKTGAVKTFELIEIEDNGVDQAAIYRAHIPNVGNVTLCIRNWFDR